MALIIGQDLYQCHIQDQWCTCDILLNHNLIGYPVYSNSKPTVNSFQPLFEMLWNSRLLAEKLQEADRLQREFIHVSAHELRTPIQPILGMAELIESA